MKYLEGRSTENERRVEGEVHEVRGDDCSGGQSFFLGWWKCSKIKKWSNYVNILKKTLNWNGMVCKLHLDEAVWKIPKQTNILSMTTSCSGVQDPKLNTEFSPEALVGRKWGSSDIDSYCFASVVWRWACLKTVPRVMCQHHLQYHADVFPPNS